MIAEPYFLRVGCSRGKDLMSRMIILAAKLAQRKKFLGKLGKARWSHVYIHNLQDDIIESVFKIRKMNPSYYSKERHVIYRPCFITDVQQHNIARIAEYCIGQQYGWGKLPLFLMDAVFRTYKFTEHFSITSFKVCSNFIGWLFKKCPSIELPLADLCKIARGKSYELNYPALNYEFGVPWRSLTPDAMHDWMHAHHDEWEKIVEVYPKARFGKLSLNPLTYIHRT